MRLYELLVIGLVSAVDQRKLRHSKIEADVSLTNSLLKTMKQKMGLIDEERLAMMDAEVKSINQLKGVQAKDKEAMLSLGNEEKVKMQALAKDLEETVRVPILDDLE